MAEQPTSVADLPRLALAAYREEYRDLLETWRSVETKAQGLGAIAGIFLAAVFAWAREVPANFGTFERVLLVASIFLLVASIVAAVLALHVRKVAAPPHQETAEMISDILKKQKPDELPARVAAFYNDQITEWKEANSDIHEHIQRKASWISCGHGTLLLASVLVATLAILATMRVP